MEENKPAPEEYAPVAIRLLRGPVYEEDTCWDQLLQRQRAVAEWLGKIGLVLRLHPADGFAYVAQPQGEEGEETLPRLLKSAKLSYLSSLLCCRLRQRLEEFDSQSTATKLFIKTTEIKEDLAPFFQTKSNASRQLQDFEVPIKKLEELGILRMNRRDESPAGDHQYEVRRILKAMVTPEHLKAFHQKIASYGAPESVSK